MKKRTLLVGVCALLAQTVYTDHMKEEEDGSLIREHRAGKSTEPFVHEKAEDSEHIITNHRAQASFDKAECQARADEAFEREEHQTYLAREHEAKIREENEALRGYSARPNRKSLEQRKKEILPRRAALTVDRETSQEVLAQAEDVQRASAVYTPEAVALKEQIKKHKKEAYKAHKEACKAAGEKHRAIRQGKLDECPEVEKAEKVKPVKHKPTKKPVKKKLAVKRGAHVEKHREEKREAKKVRTVKARAQDSKKYARPKKKTVDEQVKTKKEKKSEKKVKKTRKKEDRRERSENNEASKKRLRKVKSSNDFAKTPEHDVEEKQIKRKRLFSEDVDLHDLIQHHEKKDK